MLSSVGAPLAPAAGYALALIRIAPFTSLNISIADRAGTRAQGSPVAIPLASRFPSSRLTSSRFPSSRLLSSRLMGGCLRGGRGKDVARASRWHV